MMSTTRPNPESRPGSDPDPDEADLPDWLKALKPEDEPQRPGQKPPAAPPPAPPTPQPANAATAPRPAPPPPAPQPGEPSPTASLVDEEDLPDWLRALSTSPPAAAPPPPAAEPPASGSTLPSWAATEDAATSTGSVATPANDAPLVWSARRARPAAEEKTEPADFAGVGAPSAPEVTAEPVTPAPGAAGRGRPSPLVLVALLLVLLLIVGAVVFMTMFR